MLWTLGALIIMLVAAIPCSAAPVAASSGPAEIRHEGELVGYAQVGPDGDVEVIAGEYPKTAELVFAGLAPRSLTVYSADAEAAAIAEVQTLIGEGVKVVGDAETFAALPEAQRRAVLALQDPAPLMDAMPNGALMISTLEAYAQHHGLEVVRHTVDARPGWRFVQPDPWMGRIAEGSEMPWYGGEQGAFVQCTLGEAPNLPENAVVRAVSTIDGGPVLIEQHDAATGIRFVALDLLSPSNIPGYDGGSLNKWYFVGCLLDPRPNYGVYVQSKPTFEEYMGWYEALAERFPGSVEISQVGTGAAGDPVMAVRLGKRDAPRFIMLGCLHGGEIMPAYALYYLAEMMLENPREDQRITWLMENFELEILPVVNLWGYNKGGQVNSRDVDLNRNFPYMWEEYQGDAGWRERYGIALRGEAPFSEGEAAAVRDRVLDGEIAGFIDFHQHGRQHGNMIMISPEPLQQQLDAFVYLHSLLNTRMAGRYLEGHDTQMHIRLNSGGTPRPMARNWVSNLGIPSCVFELVGRFEDSLSLTDIAIHKALDFMSIMGMRYDPSQ